jgi:hypothetical protein
MQANAWHNAMIRLGTMAVTAAPAPAGRGGGYG